MDENAIRQLANQLLVDSVVEQSSIYPANVPSGDETDESTTVYVLPIPGVTDSQAESALAAMQQLDFDVEAVRIRPQETYHPD